MGESGRCCSPSVLSCKKTSSTRFGWCGSIAAPALLTTDLSLSVAEIIEYYDARWKIDAAFKELKPHCQEALDEDFQLSCSLPRKPSENTFTAAIMKLGHDTF